MIFITKTNIACSNVWYEKLIWCYWVQMDWVRFSHLVLTVRLCEKERRVIILPILGVSLIRFFFQLPPIYVSSKLRTYGRLLRATQITLGLSQHRMQLVKMCSLLHVTEGKACHLALTSERINWNTINFYFSILIMESNIFIIFFFKVDNEQHRFHHETTKNHDGCLTNAVIFAVCSYLISLNE